MKRKISLLVLSIASVISMYSLTPSSVIAEEGNSTTEIQPFVSNNTNEETIDSWMPDKNVQLIVMNALGLSSTNEITKTAMLQLTSFVAEGSSFTSFEGLEYATNLTTLSLVNCHLPEGFRLSFFAVNTPYLTTLRISGCSLNNDSLTGFISFYHLAEGVLDLSNNNLSMTLDDLSVLLFPPSIEAKDSTISLGTVWNAKDNFISAQDINFNDVDFSNIEVTGSVDTSKPGEYPITYTYNFNNKLANYIYKTVLVHVSTKPTLNVANTTIYIGDSWTPEDNLTSATDNYGNPVSFETITTNGFADTTKTGQYTVTYSYSGVTETATITVIDKPVISFDPTEGQTSQESLAAKIGADVNLSSVTIASRKGYQFLGWYTEKEGGIQLPLSIIMPAEGIIYYAQWKKEPSMDASTTDTKSSDQNSPSEKANNSSQNLTNSSIYNAHSLPDMGDSNAVSLIILGLLLLSYCGYNFTKLFKK